MDVTQVTQEAMVTPNGTKLVFNPVCRTRQAPYSYEILQGEICKQLSLELDITGMLLFACLTFMTLVTVLVFIEEAMYMYRKISGRIKSTIIWVNSAAPIIAVTCCVGMWIPRSTMFTDFTASVRSLFLLKLGTFQFVLLRPVLMFLAVVLWTNGTYAIGDSRAESATIYINVSVGVITITALWAVGIMFNHVRPSLVDKKIIPKFACYQFIVILSQLQTSIINILGTTGVISCVPPRPGPSRASYMNQQLLIIEMFVTTIICRTLYRRRYEEKPALGEDEETKDNLLNSTLCLNGKAMDEGLQKV